MEHSLDNIKVVKTSVYDATKAEIYSRMSTANEDKCDGFYVCDVGDIVSKYLRWKEQLPRVEPFYSLKSNSDAMFLAILAQLGIGFDCYSKEELRRVLDQNIPPSRVIYANTCKQASHIKYASSRGVDVMTFDNEVELHKIKELNPNAKLILRILPPANHQCLRHMGIKFGARQKKFAQLLKLAKELNLNVIGVSFHVGSGCYDTKAFEAALSISSDVFKLAKAFGFEFNLLDIGGGFPGIKKYKVTFEEICANLRPALDKYFPAEMNVRIIAEPGRYFTASAYTLALSVIGINEVDFEDSNFDPFSGKAMPCEIVDKDHPPVPMYYLNDGVFGSFGVIRVDQPELRFTILNEDELTGQSRHTSSLWGPTGAGIDCIIPKCEIPQLTLGDWVLFTDMGAYTMTHATKFNGMPKPPCHYLINESLWDVLGYKSDKKPSDGSTNGPSSLEQNGTDSTTHKSPKIIRVAMPL